MIRAPPKPHTYHMFLLPLLSQSHFRRTQSKGGGRRELIPPARAVRHSPLAVDAATALERPRLAAQETQVQRARRLHVVRPEQRLPPQQRQRAQQRRAARLAARERRGRVQHGGLAQPRRVVHRRARGVHGRVALDHVAFKPTAASNPVTTPENPFIDPATTPRKKNLRSEPEPELARPDSFGLVIVADLDKKSRDETSSKPLFFSFLQHATLKITKNDVLQKDEYSVKWGEKRKFTTTMNEAGRGFELSELTWFDGKLLAFDDRTGIVYRLKDFEGGKPIRAIPEHIVMEGDGITGKGQKHEWATVKDDELYMGSVGKEYTDNDGNVLADSNLWVAVMDKHGEVHHEDWTSNFARVRTALGADWPGYVVHEAIEWSPVHRQWFILPRRVSTEAYNDMLDEKRGSNKLVVASEDFSTIEVREVGKLTPLRGFSSFKFLPRTGDNIIVAIKSVEIDVENLQTSFITVFDIKGNTLLEETELPGGHKYEGIALLHDWSQD
ncbi:Soluble calcium-activated nucleotidase, partial [Globisporangium splendens]